MVLWWLLLVSSAALHKNYHRNSQWDSWRDKRLCKSLSFKNWILELIFPMEAAPGMSQYCIYSHVLKFMAPEQPFIHSQKRFLWNHQLEDLKYDLCHLSMDRFQRMLLFSKGFSSFIILGYQSTAQDRPSSFPRILRLKLALSHMSNRRKECLGQVGSGGDHSRDYNEYPW